MKLITVGLTGQTGSGKSTVSRVLSENGIYVIDCDRLSRDITSDGSECCKALSEFFPSCFDARLHLDRSALGKVVFGDIEKLRQLNDCIFPFIRAEIDRRIEKAVYDGNHIVVLDAPTLFEAGADKQCDIIISCVSDEQDRLRRITVRDSLTDEQAKNRMSSQKSEEFFRANSDIVIDNNSGEGGLRCAALFLAEQLKGKAYGDKKEKKEKEKWQEQ